MRKGAAKRDNAVLRGLCGALCAVPVILLIDFALAKTHNEPRVRYAMLIAAAVLLAFTFVAVKFPKVCKALRIFMYAAYIPVLLWLVFYFCSAYHNPDRSDKAGLFAGRNLMLIVPHEDDELNLLGGVIEQYVSYGSTVRVVFATNGDFFGVESGRKRIAEAIKVLTNLGVHEENIIFLGYSDSMTSEQGYFYNLGDKNTQLYSQKKDASATYGIEGHPAFNDGNSFTRMHLFEDIKACILKYRPDTLICVDHDPHRDHMALSLLFAKAMGRILAEEPDYKPLVLKGMAYTTSYYGADDFFSSVNLRSTQKPFKLDYMKENHVYLWQDRVRLPISADSYSRSIFACKMWDAALFYDTQNLISKAGIITNGDKVFWPRATTSLLYSASVTASSGKAERLNDFSLGDNFQVPDIHTPIGGVWTPSAEDEKPQIRVSLAAPKNISLLKFYDAQSPDDNILKLTVRFDSGNIYEVGPLNPLGDAYSVAVDEKNVSSFVITVEESAGKSAGLTEIEAYENAPDYGLNYIKLTDDNDNFVYDYITAPSGEAEFSLYAVGAPKELNNDNYTLTCSDKRCSAEISDGVLRLVCPRGAGTVLRITAADGSVSESVYVHNPLIRGAAFWMKVDKFVLEKLILPNAKDSNVWKIRVFLHNDL